VLLAISVLLKFMSERKRKAKYNTDEVYFEGGQISGMVINGYLFTEGGIF
jgi:hypothetical protein